jgi:hypothetical protein
LAPLRPLANEIEKVVELHRDERRLAIILANSDGPTPWRTIVDRLPQRFAWVGALVPLELGPEAGHLDVGNFVTTA